MAAASTHVTPDTVATVGMVQKTLEEVVANAEKVHLEQATDLTKVRVCTVSLRILESLLPDVRSCSVWFGFVSFAALLLREHPPPFLLFSSRPFPTHVVQVKSMLLLLNDRVRKLELLRAGAAAGAAGATRVVRPTATLPAASSPLQPPRSNSNAPLASRLSHPRVPGAPSTAGSPASRQGRKRARITPTLIS